jgi:hypothetical protein
VQVQALDKQEMTMLGALVPTFRAFPEEGLIVGRLLTGYTAIEYQLCMCAGMGGGDVAKAITDIFSKRGETRRVKTIAPRLGGAGYTAVGLGAEFDEAIEDMLLCVTIRNQYAHCIWHDAHQGRLIVAHMEEIAAPTGPGPDPINLTFHYVDVGLLSEQEAFFAYVQCQFNYLNYRRRQIIGEIDAGANIRIPVKVPRPRLKL